jgi:glycosyltransferase involved in cell wall biosynthesis
MCGIATFTADVKTALTAADSDLAIDVYAMNEPGADHRYGPEVVYALRQNELADYQTAAHRINVSGADAVLVQHEYGIFGGPAGNMLLKLLDRVDAPVVVALHTVLENPNADQRAVIDALARRASKLIVLAEKGKEILKRVHGIADDRIQVVLHGVHDRPLISPEMLKPRFGFEGRKVVLTFGLLSPNKGIETVIRALPAVAARHPEILYVVLGATHPHLVAQQGEAYRDSLIMLAESLDVSKHVRFIDDYLELDPLLDYIQAIDIYATPYLNEAQIVSGTLSYAVALGKPVVSTPYWHAAELITPEIGELVPFGSSDGFAAAINRMLDCPEKLDEMRRNAWKVGRGMTWAKLAEAYLEIMADALERKPVRLIQPGPVTYTAIEPNLLGIERMTDSCGMAQHSIFHIPDRDHGYCVDDNARALMLMHRFRGDTKRADELAHVYASFVQHAWNGEKGRFRNFMGYARNWLEEEGSQDSFGRSLWSIGLTASEARSGDLRRWGLHLFDQVAPHAYQLEALRARAFAILAADAICEAHPGHAIANSLLTELSATLYTTLRSTRRDDWVWFEPTLAYDNARLPEALMRAGHRLGNRDYIDAALEAFRWLRSVQQNKSGQFRAVGTDSFGQPYRPPLPFDQQPLEAWATIDAALFAHGLDRDGGWLDCAWSAYCWYLGDNDLGLPMVNPSEGECFDGLMSDRANLNQGAESVLSFQFACVSVAEMEARAGRVLTEGSAENLAS